MPQKLKACILPKMVIITATSVLARIPETPMLFTNTVQIYHFSSVKCSSCTHQTIFVSETCLATLYNHYSFLFLCGPMSIWANYFIIWLPYWTSADRWLCRSFSVTESLDFFFRLFIILTYPVTHHSTHFLIPCMCLQLCSVPLPAPTAIISGTSISRPCPTFNQIISTSVLSNFTPVL